MSKYRLPLLLRASLNAGIVSVCLLLVYLPAARAQFNANACGAIMEQFSLVPYSSWGSTPVNLQQIWDASDCNHKVCQYMKDKYGVVPHQSWGSLPGNLQQVWDTPQVDCNHHVTASQPPPAPKPIAGNGFSPPSWCPGRNLAENRICDSPKLWALDAELSREFNLVKNGDDPADARASEQEWLKARNACEVDEACLQALYKSRIAFLSGLLPNNAQQPPATAQPQPSLAQSSSCQDMWVERNQIYKNAGYCFETQRAINFFGNGGCSIHGQNRLHLSEGAQRRIAQIEAQEGRMGCN